MKTLASCLPSVLGVAALFPSVRSRHGERLLARQIHLMDLLRVFLRPGHELVVVFRSDGESARAVDDFLHDNSFLLTAVPR